MTETLAGQELNERKTSSGLVKPNKENISSKGGKLFLTKQLAQNKGKSARKVVNSQVQICMEIVRENFPLQLKYIQ